MQYLIKLDFNNLNSQPEDTYMTEGLNLSALSDNNCLMESSLLTGVREYRSTENSKLLLNSCRDLGQRKSFCWMGRFASE